MVPSAGKSLSCSRTFGRPLSAFSDVLGAVSAFLSRAAEKLRAQGDTAHVLTVYISKNRFAANVLPPFSRSATLTLPIGPTADTTVLLSYARALLHRLWEPGTVYHKAGVVLDGLEPPGVGLQLSLFGGATAPPPLEPKREEQTIAPARPGLMASLDALNLRFGKGAVRLAAAVPSLEHRTAAGKGSTAPWEGKARWCSPAFTTRLEDLLQVN